MVEGWSDVRLGDLVVNFDNRRKPVKASDRAPGPYPYYGASGVVDYVDGYVLDGQYLLVSEDGENLRTRSTPIAFTVDGPFWPNNHVHVLRGIEKFDTFYLKYAIERTDLLGYLTGSAQPKLTRRALDSLRLSVPPHAHRRAIVEVLGALDDKIEANRKLATTADDLLASRMAELLERSDRSVPLGELALLNPDKKSPVEGGHLRYLDIASVGVGNYEWPPLTEWEAAPSRARRGIQPGDIVWSSVRPKRRSRALVLDNDPNLVVSTGLTVIRPRHGEWATLFEVLRRPEFTGHLEAVATGSAYPAVKPHGFAAAPVPWFADEDVAEFEGLASRLRLRLASAARENRSLSDLRDTLLPKLMSGQLRVEEAAELVRQ